MLGGSVAALALATAGWAIGVRINITPSLPGGLYRLTTGAPIRGSTVLVCLPTEAARSAKSRGYVGRGSCADGVEPVGKIVLAVDGDSVAVTPDGIVVNGALVAGTRPLMKDSRGRDLPRLRRQAGVVTRDSLWLYSPYSASSYDSRYFGPVHSGRVIGTVRPLLVFNPAPHVFTANAPR